MRFFRDGDGEQAILHALEDYDERNGSSLVDTLRCWMFTGCRFDETADRLGVHRHTVRLRLGKASDVLGVDLDDVRTRAVLWVAFRAGVMGTGVGD